MVYQLSVGHPKNIGSRSGLAQPDLGQDPQKDPFLRFTDIFDENGINKRCLEKGFTHIGRKNLVILLWLSREEASKITSMALNKAWSLRANGSGSVNRGVLCHFCNKSIAHCFCATRG